MGLRRGSGLKIELDTRDAEKAVGRVFENQIPFAMMLTLNEVGGEALQKVEDEIESAFDNPTRWTKKAFYLRRAKKNSLYALIERKTAVGRRNYLETQSEGGIRPQTALEKLLTKRLPYSGTFRTVTPAAGAKLNRYGNVSPGQLQKVLSGVKAQRDSAQNQTKKSKARHRRRESYFVAKPKSEGGSLSPGIYSKAGGKTKKIFHFSDSAAKYQKRLNVAKPVEKVVARDFAPKLARHLQRAIKTAR